MSNYNGNNNYQWQNSEQQYGYGYSQPRPQQYAPQQQQQQQQQPHGMSNGQAYPQHQQQYPQHVPQLQGQYQNAQPYPPPQQQQQQQQQQQFAYQQAQYQIPQQQHYSQPNLQHQQYSLHPPQQPQFSPQQRHVYQQQPQQLPQQQPQAQPHQSHQPQQHQAPYQPQSFQTQQMQQSPVNQQRAHPSQQLQYPSPQLSSQPRNESPQVHHQQISSKSQNSFRPPQAQSSTHPSQLRGPSHPPKSRTTSYSPRSQNASYPLQSQTTSKPPQSHNSPFSLPAQAQNYPQPKQIPSGPSPKPPITSTSPQNHSSTSHTGLKPITNGHIPSEPSEDYCILLLSLSEDFFEQAQQTLQVSHDDQVEYFQNMSMGLRCLETILKKFSNAMSPPLLASTQLQYATLLYEETNNDFEAEEILSTGITMCERNQLIGYQYHMEHLLSRTIFLSNPKAAFKRLDNVIQSAVLRKHYAWIYALRFLRVDLSLRLESSHDRRAAFSNLQSLIELAKSRGDSAIAGLSAIIEAWIHITQRNPDTISDAQRSLATARAQQHAFEHIPQVVAATLTLDLICSLEPYETPQAIEKMKALTAFLEGQSSVGENQIHVSLRGISTQDESLKGASGVVDIIAENVSLHLTWLSMSDISALGYLLWSNASFAKNSSDGHKAESMLGEGMKLTDDDHLKFNTSLLSTAAFRRRRRVILRCYMLAQAAFCQCDRSDWKRAPETLRRLNELLSSPDLDAPHDLHLLSAYLSAVTQHSQGNIDAALGIYETLSSDLPSFSSRDGVSLQQTLALLALVQSLLILRSPSHPQHYTSQALLDRLSSFLKDPHSAFVSQNPHIAAAHALLLAIYQPSIDDTINLSTEPTDKQLAILPTKAQLQRCLDHARRVSNSLLLTMCMSYMHFLFYQGIVGEQGIQAARVARFAAKEAGSAMWMAAGDGVLSEVMAWNGFRDRSADYWAEGVALAEKLPAKIQERLSQ